MPLRKRGQRKEELVDKDGANPWIPQNRVVRVAVKVWTREESLSTRQGRKAISWSRNHRERI